MGRTGHSLALVLGAGGALGQAFHAGLLRALSEVYDPRRADLVVGTSAGAIAGALLRAGVTADELFAAAHGDSPLSSLVRSPRGARPIGGRWPASPDYLRQALRRPLGARPGRLVSALLPEGGFDNHLLGETIRRLHPSGWPARALWVTAVSIDCGTRVVFGHPEAPPIDLGTAVRCSAAVPGLRRPVRVGARRFIDGGIASPTHLDVLGDAPPPLVLVSSPLSRFWPLRLLLRIEARRLRSRVVLFEPDAEVCRAMAWNPMDTTRTAAVAAASYRAARRQLERSADLRAVLGAA
jgi:NTE family protein